MTEKIENRNGSTIYRIGQGTPSGSQEDNSFAGISMTGGTMSLQVRK